VTVFVDTAVIMYAAGTEHPLRDPSRRILEMVESGKLAGVTSTQVIQEIAHRFMSIDRRDIAERLSASALDLFAPVLPISHAVTHRLPELIARYPGLAVRDLIHVATCQHEGITEIVSPDRGFDSVVGLRRVDPATFTADRP
jgi:predicted nucleic acid-binding protein